mmetsp:Transcript_7764/g.16066  ORF Transcript_7764/g.16066 Transcript_7764/m.16066 type:complete len:93 (+) Transcript_7764:727-1005(+)
MQRLRVATTLCSFWQVGKGFGGTALWQSQAKRVIIRKKARWSPRIHWPVDATTIVLSPTPADMEEKDAYPDESPVNYDDDDDGSEHYFRRAR